MTEIELKKAEFKDKLEDYLFSTGRSTTKNIRCINPAHPDHNPSMRYDPERKCLHCFSCDATYDIFDVVGIDENLNDFASQYKRVNELYGDGTETAIMKIASETIKNRGKYEPVNYEDFFLKANEDLYKTDYHRGISTETLNRFKVGYVDNWKHPKSPNFVQPTSRLIIPTSNESYIARDTDPEAKKDKYAKQKVGKVHIFNIDALKTAQKPIFVVEGEIDALSLIDVGAEAIGLGSITMARQFRSMLGEYKPAQPLIIALDNEDKQEVKDAINLIKVGAEAVGIKTYETMDYGDYKDANEMLQAGRDKLAKAVALAEEKVKEQEESEEEAERKEHLSHRATTLFTEFIGNISNPTLWDTYSTGFSNFDAILDGGLTAGFYVLGAVPSLGKTTMMLQIADNIARNNDVLIFSLEMSKDELMAKSVSRFTYMNSLALSGDGKKNAKTTKGILEASKRFKYWTDEDHKVFDNALKDYQYLHEHLYIFEGLGSMGVDAIKERVEKHIRLTGNRPAVFVDYLQMLAPYNERTTDKQNVDKNVLELKRIASQSKVPLFVVSSLNRAGYKGKVSMEDFKESGAVEYGADVLLGLQFANADSSNFDINEEKQKEIREVELLVLKNRNGITGKSAQFDYYPAFNYMRATD